MYALKDAATVELQNGGDSGRALVWLRRAIPLFQTRVKTKYFDPAREVAKLRKVLAQVLCDLGRSSEAELPARQSMAYFEEHPSDSTVLGCMYWALAARAPGRSLLGQDKAEQAEPVFRDAAEFAERRHRLKPEDIGTTRWRANLLKELAECLDRMGHGDEANSVRARLASSKSL